MFIYFYKDENYSNYFFSNNFLKSFREQKFKFKKNQLNLKPKNLKRTEKLKFKKSITYYKKDDF